MSEHFDFDEFHELVTGFGSDAPANSPSNILVNRLLASKRPIDRTGPGLFSLVDASEMIGISRSTLRAAEDKGLIDPLPLSKHTIKSNGKDVPKAAGVPFKAITQLRDHYKKSRKYQLKGKSIVIAVQTQKGGVSKSTSANILGQGLALQGYRVCIIDHDPQGTQTQNFGYYPIDFSQTDLIQYFPELGSIGTDQNKTLAAFYQSNGYQDLNDLTIKTGWENIDVITADSGLFESELGLHHRYSDELAKANSLSISEQDSAVEAANNLYFGMLKRGIDKLKQHYDVVLIDSPPSVSLFSVNIFAAADGVIMPTPPRIHDWASTIAFQGNMLNFKGVLDDEHMKFKFIKCLVTLIQPAKKKTHIKIAQEFRDSYTSKYHFKNSIRNLAEIEESYSNYLSPFEYKGVKKSTKMELMEVVRELDDLILDVLETREGE